MFAKMKSAEHAFQKCISSLNNDTSGLHKSRAKMNSIEEKALFLNDRSIKKMHHSIETQLSSSEGIAMPASQQNTSSENDALYCLLGDRLAS
jgi:hypothetical protein